MSVVYVCSCVCSVQVYIVHSHAHGIRLRCPPARSMHNAFTPVYYYTFACTQRHLPARPRRAVVQQLRRIASCTVLHRMKYKYVYVVTRCTAACNFIFTRCTAHAHAPANSPTQLQTAMTAQSSLNGRVSAAAGWQGGPWPYRGVVCFFFLFISSFFYSRFYVHFFVFVSSIFSSFFPHWPTYTWYPRIRILLSFYSQLLWLLDSD